LWQNRRWTIAYTNLFLFGGLYVVGSLLIGLALAILIDQRVRGEAVWRSVLLYPLALSFVVTGTVWRWIFNPTTGVQAFVRDLGFAASTSTGSSIANAPSTRSLSPASGTRLDSQWCCCSPGCVRSTRNLVKAAQIDGASMARIYRRILIPSIWPIIDRRGRDTAAVRDQDLRPRSGADGRRTWTRDQRPGDLRL